MRVNAILRLSAVFAACVVIGVPAVAQRIIRLGDAAPPLKLGLIVQGKMDHYPQQGRAMLIEFWAVSCSPCVAAIPHLNELVERFRDQPIDFVSIDVFEDANTVKKFLGAHRMEGVVALDGDPGTAPDYGLTATPVTVLIGRDGHVVAFTHPSQLNTVVVEQLLSGQPVRLAPFGAAGLTAAVPVQHSYFLQDPIGTRDRSLVNVVVVPTAEEGSSVDGPNQFESTGVDLVSLLSFAYDISPSQIDLPELLAHELYKVQARVP